MQALVDDYEAFCSEMELLPKDRYLVFVPPCGISFEDNLQFKLYYCPATWTRRKARYLGIYAKKAVRAIGQVDKIVACEVSLETNKVSVQNGSPPLTKAEEERILAACRNGGKYGWNLSTGHKFYLCDDLVKTDFSKKSSGGIAGHRYFDLRDYLGSVIPQEVVELASVLRQYDWQ